MKAMPSEWEDRGVKAYEGVGKKHSADCHLDFLPENGEDEGIEREHAWPSMKSHVRSPELSNMRVEQLSVVLDIIPQMLTTTITTMTAERQDYRTVPR